MLACIGRVSVSDDNEGRCAAGVGVKREDLNVAEVAVKDKMRGIRNNDLDSTDWRRRHGGMHVHTQMAISKFAAVITMIVQ